MEEKRISASSKIADGQSCTTLVDIQATGILLACQKRGHARVGGDQRARVLGFRKPDLSDPVSPLARPLEGPLQLRPHAVRLGRVPSLPDSCRFLAKTGSLARLVIWL